MNRRRIRKIKFSSLEFLTELARRRMRKINLRRILILALRTAAVILIVMAFARPTLRGASFLLPGKAPKNMVICLDASYSMGVDKKKGTAFTAAKQIASTIVNEAEHWVGPPHPPPPPSPELQVTVTEAVSPHP